MNLAMVVVAAGRGARFGGDKLAEKLGSRTVLETSLEALRRAFPKAPLVVVVPPERKENWIERLAENYSECQVVAGGPRRQDSVQNGVRSAAALGAEVVAIHDAARPLVDPQDVKGVVWAIGDAPAAILSAPVIDTVKHIDNDGMIVDTVSRDDLRLALTPQVFKVEALERAWGQVAEDQVWTDESMLLELVGIPVRSVVAQFPNPKLTGTTDLQFLRALKGTLS